MSVQRHLHAFSILFLAMVAGLCQQTTAHAQGIGGVRIDADGVLRMQWLDPTGALHAQRVMAAKAALDRDVARKSPLSVRAAGRPESFRPRGKRC